MPMTDAPSSWQLNPWQLAAADLQWSESEEPFSAAFGDIYFSRGDGLAETKYVFIQQNHLEQRWRALDPARPGVFTIGETGFGTGLNFLCAWQLWRAIAPRNWRLHYVSVEKFPLDIATLQRTFNSWQQTAPWPEFSELGARLLAHYPPRITGFHLRPLDNTVSLQLLFGDATEQLNALHHSAAPELPNRFHIDAWFLDGFAPAKNPEMWQSDLFEQIGRLSKPGTTFATFTVAGIVKRGMQEAGFAIEKFAGFGSKRQMLRGEFRQPPSSVPNASTAASRSSLSFAATVGRMDADSEPPWMDSRRVVANDKDERRLVRTVDYWSYSAASVDKTPTKHIAIIGGGLAGCTSANALARRGYRVTLIEKETALAAAASGNSQGVLYTKLSAQAGALNRFALASYLFALDFYRPLIEDDPALGDFCGVLQYANDDAQWQQLQQAFSQQQEWLQFVDAQQASALAGFDIEYAALWFSRAGWLAPAKICERLAQREAIEIRTQCQVNALIDIDDKWQIECARETIVADAVVIANAHTANSFVQTAHLPLKAIRGQITELPAKYLRAKPRAVICASGYIAPTTTGAHIGATFDVHSNDIGDCAVRADDHRRNLDTMQSMLPNLLAQAPAANTLEGRVGYRCTTPDYLPIAGAVSVAETMRARYARLAKNANARATEPGSYWPGLYINVGHGSRGLTSTPLCAELLAATIAGEPPPLPRDLVQSLAPARFLLRDLIRGR